MWRLRLVKNSFEDGVLEGTVYIRMDSDAAYASGYDQAQCNIRASKNSRTVSTISDAPVKGCPQLNMVIDRMIDHYLAALTGQPIEEWL